MTEYKTLDLEAWNELSPAEVDFWDRWITNKGERWPKDFERRTDPDAPLASLLTDLLPHLDLPTERPVRIMDIGAGPLSYVGHSHDTYRTEITVVDPLAEDYNRLLDGAGVTGVPRPQKGYFETALADFGEGAFDVV